MDTRVAPTSLLARVRKAARENGAILVGVERSGRFSHELVKGEYRMVGPVEQVREAVWVQQVLGVVRAPRIARPN